VLNLPEQHRQCRETSPVKDGIANARVKQHLLDVSEGRSCTTFSVLNLKGEQDVKGSDTFGEVQAYDHTAINLFASVF
jgi:hypothetical protein